MAIRWYSKCHGQVEIAEMNKRTRRYFLSILSILVGISLLVGSPLTARRCPWSFAISLQRTIGKHISFRQRVLVNRCWINKTLGRPTLSLSRTAKIIPFDQILAVHHFLNPDDSVLDTARNQQQSVNTGWYL